MSGVLMSDSDVSEAEAAEPLDFDSYYSEHLEPILEEFEVHRKEVKKKSILSYSIGGGVGLLLGGLISLSWNVPLAIFVLVISLVIAGFIVHGARKEYILSFKNEVVGRIAGFAGENVQYYPENYIQAGEYHASRIFKKSVDRYKGEDLFTGIHGKTDSGSAKFTPSTKRRARIQRAIVELSGTPFSRVSFSLPTSIRISMA